MNKHISLFLIVLLLPTLVQAVKIIPQSSPTVHPGEFQTFYVDVTNDEDKEQKIVLYIQKSENIFCFFENQNTIEVLSMKPQETKTILVNVFANVNVKSQESACMLTYITNLSDKSIGILEEISKNSEITIENYTIPVGRIFPTYVVVRGNVTTPSYYIPERIVETIQEYKVGLYALSFLLVSSWIFFILNKNLHKKKRRKVNKQLTQ